MTSRPPHSPDDFGENDDTVIDGTPLVDDNVTPTSNPRCVECGEIAFVDNAALVSFPGDRCLRAIDAHWHWCRVLRKSVTYVPR